MPSGVAQQADYVVGGKAVAYVVCKADKGYQHKGQRVPCQIWQQQRVHAPAELVSVAAPRPFSEVEKKQIAREHTEGRHGNIGERMSDQFDKKIQHSVVRQQRQARGGDGYAHRSAVYQHYQADEGKPQHVNCFVLNLLVSYFGQSCFHLGLRVGDIVTVRGVSFTS